MRRNDFVATAVVLLVLTTVSVGMRFYVRGAMIKSFGTDDVLLLITYILFLALAALLLEDAVVEQAPELITVLPKIGDIAIASQTLYRFCQIFLKLCLATFFLRVVIRPWQRWLIIVSVGLYTVYGIANAFVVIFQCGPHPYALMLFFKEENCLPTSVLEPLGYVSTLSNCITDWIMVASPVFVISTLKVSRREKGSIFALILLGIAGSVVSLVRVVWVASVYAPEGGDHDTAIAICSVVESGIGIIAVSLAALRPLFARFMEVARGSTGMTGIQATTVYEVSHANDKSAARSRATQFDDLDGSDEEKGMGRREDDTSKADLA